MKLYTVGYEGTDIHDFTESLRDNGIRCVADVRKNPVSRKRGFSKRLLGEALAEVGIDYVHVPGLGVPTEWRKQAKAEIITRKKMFSDYVKKILPRQTEDIDLLAKLMKKKGLVLLCYEADAHDCHRIFVVNALVKSAATKVQVVNLQVLPDTQLGTQRIKRIHKGASSGESNRSSKTRDPGDSRKKTWKAAGTAKRSASRTANPGTA